MIFFFQFSEDNLLQLARIQERIQIILKVSKWLKSSSWLLIFSFGGKFEFSC